MIQRIQSIYLFLAALTAAGLFITPVKEQIFLDPTAWISVLFIVALILASATPVVAIFLFQNRSVQMQVVRTGLFFSIVLLGFAVGVLLSMGGFGWFMLDEILSTGLPVLSVLLQALALRAIRRDEDLVKSIDRIR